MKINHKLKLVAAGFLLPISILLYLLISEKNLSIDFAQQELEGTKLLRPVLQFQHDNRTANLNSVKEKSFLLKEKIENLFESVNEKYTHLLPQSYIDSLQKIFLKEANNSSRILEEIDNLIFVVGNKSNLILDPDLDSYYLMDVILHRTPKIQRQLYNLASGKINLNSPELFLETLKHNLDETEKSLNVSIDNNGHTRVKDNLKNSFVEAAQSIIKINDRLRTAPADDLQIKLDAVSALNTNFLFIMNALDQLEILLELRIKDLQERMYLALGLVGLLLLLTGFLFYFITRRISQSVQILEDAATKVMNGELNIKVDIKSNDEFGGLSENFNRMIEHIGTSIKENFERLTKTETALNAEIKKHTMVEEALHKSEFLFKQVWDISSQGMRLSDKDGNIIAANEAYCKIVQLPLEMIKGKPFSNIYHPSLRKEILDVYIDDFSNNKIKPHFEREAVLWNDTYVCLEFSNSLLTLSDKSNLVLSTIENITQRKKFEAELKNSAEQLRNLSSHLQSIREEERKLIAREIHDELGQVLTVLKIQVSLLSNKLRNDQEDLKEKIESVIKVIDQSVESVQRITAKLRPGILDDLGLIPAIEWQAEEFTNRTGIKTVCSIPKEEIKIDTEKSTALFRMLQEALTNAARHANANLIEIFVEVKENNFILQVTDNGKGISSAEINDSSSLGLLGMKERALLLNGEVKISGSPGKGTHITAVIPLNTKLREENYDKYSYS